MLSIYQSEKIAIARKLIKEVQQEIGDADIHKAIVLGGAVEACEQVLKEDLSKEYSYTPLPEKKLQRVLTPGERILEGLSSICGYSLTFAGLIACLSLGCWGTAEIFNTNLRVESELKSQSRSYLGISTIFLSIAAGSVLLATRVDKEI